MHRYLWQVFISQALERSECLNKHLIIGKRVVQFRCGVYEFFSACKIARSAPVCTAVEEYLHQRPCSPDLIETMCYRLCFLGVNGRKYRLYVLTDALKFIKCSCHLNVIC